MVCEGLLRTGFAYPSRRFERPRRSPSSLTLRAMIGLGEDRCDPCLAGEPRTDANQSPSPALPHSTRRQPRFVRDPEWLNWLYPCHVACLERSTERSNSTLNDCNRRYFRALQAMGDYAAQCRRVKRSFTDPPKANCTSEILRLNEDKRLFITHQEVNFIQTKKYIINV